MAASGNIASLVVADAAGGRLIVTGTFSALTVLSSIGARVLVTIRVTRDGVTTSSQVQYLAERGDQYTVRDVFDIEPGAPVQVDLFAQVTGASSVSIEGVTLMAELIKR